MALKSAKKLLIPLLAGLVCLSASMLLRAADPAGLSIVRERVFDLYQRVNPREIGPQIPVRIVDIDDASLAAFGQWPWPRDLMAQLVTTLSQAGAASIALDMIFPEPDRDTPSRRAGLGSLADLAHIPGLSDEARTAFQSALVVAPSYDQVFADTLAQTPSVLGVAVSPNPNTGRPAFSPLAGFATVGPNPAPSLTQSPSTIGNLPLLEQAASGLGGIHVSARDDDAIVRRIPALTRVGTDDASTILPSLFIETLRVAQGAASLVVRTNPDPQRPDFGIPQDVRVGAMTVPLTQTGSYRLLYGRLDPALTLSAADVLAARDNPQALAARIGGTLVLVGTSAPGLFDLRATPLGTIEPGVTMHAQALASLVEGLNLVRPDWTDGLELTVMAVLGAVIIAAALLLRPIISAPLVALLLLTTGFASWWAFGQRLMLVDASAPIMAGLVTYAAVAIPMFIGTDRQQRFIRNAFSLYLAPSVLARLEADPSALALEGSRRDITILFMDVRSFTSRSEHMEPAEAVALLNSLLEPVSNAVLAQEGTIDKFMGDGMMAFWNAPLDQPDHAARAVRAAMAMIEAIKTFNTKKETEDAPIAIGVGVHTGEAFVGNMGSKRRFAYSAIGDAVNLAARVEGLSATLGHKLLITSATRQAAQASQPGLTDAFQSVGEHSVKGRVQSVQLFALQTDKIS